MNISNIAVLAIVVASSVLAEGAVADTYPARPVRVVVPYAPGGTSDIIARVLAQKFTESMGQQVVVDNRTGANGIIAVEAVVRAPSDGYTLLVGSSGELCINASLYGKLSYDTLKNLTPISMTASSPLLLVMHPSLPARTVQELVALARKKPGEIVYASAGTGSPQHLTAELFKSMAGIELTHSPYKGGAPATVAVLSGEAQLFFAGIPPVIAHVKSGKLRALAVSTAARASLLPQVPTLDESGLRGFDTNIWWGLLAPAGLPRQLVDQLNRETAKGLEDALVRQRLADIGADVVVNDPAHFADYIRSETRKYGKIVKASGARAD